MGKIVDYKCEFETSAGLPEEVLEKLDVVFPEAYKAWEPMVKIAQAVKAHENLPYCELPFCHTLEGEALGGLIQYGNGRLGPRAGSYTCTTAEDLMALPDIDYSAGRMAEVLRACTHLRADGENVVLMISGPFTILNVLMDPRHVFKIMKKNPEAMQNFFDKLQRELLNFVEKAQEAGVNMISYADSSGGVNILGPVLAEQVVEQFTYGFFKNLRDTLKSDTVVLVCPKTTMALLGTNRATWHDLCVSRPMSYQEACLAARGQVQFVGQTCLKNRDFYLEDGILKALQLMD